MAVTSPWGIPLFDGNTMIESIDGLLNSQSEALNTALNSVVNLFRSPSGAAATLSSTGHPFQIGANGGLNLRLDNNEIFAVNNGAASTLGVNSTGGDINLGNSGSKINIAGHIDSAYTPWEVAAGTVGATTISAGTAIATNITFPAGRFSVAPIVVACVEGDARDTTVTVDSTTADGFILRRGSVSIVSRSIGARWIAIQMKSGAAAG